MFDFTSSKLLILGIVALLVIGPKDLPALLRTIGKYMGIIKRQANEFRAQFDEAMRESELSRPQEGGRDASAGDRGDRSARPSSTVQSELDAAPHRAWTRRWTSPSRAADADDARTPVAQLRRPAAGACRPRTPPARSTAPRAATPTSRPPSREPRRRARPRAREERSLTPCRRRVNAGARGQPRGHDEIEASKAPLMDHLIELRQRLIYALIGVGIGFVICFAFATDIYNLLVWPYQVGARRGPEDRDDLHRPARVLLHQAEARPVRRGVPGVPDHRHAGLQVRRARPLQERARRPSGPTCCATFVLFIAGARGRLFRRHAAGHEVLPVDGADGRAGRDPPAGQGERVPLADHDADPRLRHHVPAAGGADPAGAGRHRRRAEPARISAATPSSPSRRRPACSRRPTPSA